MAIDKHRATAMMIHTFAGMHAATAAALANTMIGDEAALTAMTIAMIVAIAKLNGADWDTGSALSFLGITAGNYVGTRGALMLIKWMPGIGNMANAIATAGTTEIIGWATYAFIRAAGSDANPEELTKKDASELFKKAQRERKEAKKLIELYEKMSSEDKKHMGDIARNLADDSLSEEQRKLFESEMDRIIDKYAESNQGGQ